MTQLQELKTALSLVESPNIDKKPKIKELKNYLKIFKISKRETKLYFKL